MIAAGGIFIAIGAAFAGAVLALRALGLIDRG